MAKRRKEKDEEEDKPFKMPKFDEEAFLKRERRNIKTTFISFLFGILMALVCFGFWALMGENDQRWLLVLLVGIVNAAFLKYIFVRLNIDLADFGRKNWFGSYAIYFFTWLVLFIVIVNPPFYDDEAPLIDLVELPGMQEPGGTVMILAKITDNAGIVKDDINFELTDPDGVKSSPTFEYNDNIFIYSNQGPDNISESITYEYTLTVTDHSGLRTIKTGDFIYSKDVIDLALPMSGDTVLAASDIKFSVEEDVWRVFYKVNNGKEINATQQTDRTDFYITSPEYEGWVTGENVTVNVTAVVVHNFVNHFLRTEDGKLFYDKNNLPIPYWFVNYINDTSTYLFDVVDESTVGTNDKIPAPPTLTGRIAAAPGFEILVFIISLIAVIIITRKRKNNRSKKK